MANCLVTGGAGFLGSHLADELLELGHTVVVLDDLSGGRRANVPAAAEFVQGSVVDRPAVADLFERHHFNYVFHLAAYAAEGLSHHIKFFNYENNLLGSVNLINAAVNAGSVRCFVFTSSIAVYGSARTPMTESQDPRPEDPYGIAKMAVERELQVTHEVFGLPYIIFRPHNVYGERQNLGDRYRNVIGIFMNQAMRGLPFTIFGDGEQTRAFTHIADVAPVIAHAVETPAAYGEIINVGADHPYSINELAGEVAAAMGVKLEIRRLPERYEVRHAVADQSRVRELLGQYITGIDLPHGLRAMAQWARSQGPQSVRSRYDIEIPQRLPAAWQELAG